MKQYDYLIVGAGLFGAVFAQQATKAGKSCLVIDKRDHIAGNIYTENVEGHAAQISDLNFQLMAFAVDDLYVPLGHLILLALAFIQHVQRVHLFFHGRLFEQLSLQI